MLQSPVLPLVSMVNFFLLTGDFTSVNQVLDELPDPIETAFTKYIAPIEHLAPYTDALQRLLDHRLQDTLDYCVITPDGKKLDREASAVSMLEQTILTHELERINSALCAPCNCRLCCTGPKKDMKQSFFEIPLKDKERILFDTEVIDTSESQTCNAMDDSPFLVEGIAFYSRKTPVCIHWKKGWSLILPTKSDCPNLKLDSGRCLVYTDRPEVCRRPQIFPYILEPIDELRDQRPVYRLRRSILAIMDCPYVSLLQKEIAAYAAACELDIVFSYNKE